jgi:hypothetical protein
VSEEGIGMGIGWGLGLELGALWMLPAYKRFNQFLIGSGSFDGPGKA